jgi:hypothetical protein
MNVDWNSELAEQLDWHWREALRPRFDGLTDDEYFWEPVPGMWSIRPHGTSTAAISLGGGAFATDYDREADPEPVTTIGLPGTAHQPRDLAPRRRDRPAARPVPLAAVAAGSRRPVLPGEARTRSE